MVHYSRLKLYFFFKSNDIKHTSRSAARISKGLKLKFIILLLKSIHYFDDVIYLLYLSFVYFVIIRSRLVVGCYGWVLIYNLSVLNAYLQ